MIRFLCVYVSLARCTETERLFLPSYSTKYTFYEIMDVFENHGYLSQKFCGNPALLCEQ